MIHWWIQIPLMQVDWHGKSGTYGHNQVIRSLVPPSSDSGLFMPRPRPSADELWKLFSYNPVTGEFGVLGRGRAAIRRGYLTVSLGGNKVAIQTIIWAMMTGEYSKKTIDHEDLDPMNNRWRNLREANQAQQQVNRRLFKNNKSGYRGVYLQPSGRWQAHIRFDKKTHNLGTFDSPQEAAKVVQEIRETRWGKFAGTATL